MATDRGENVFEAILRERDRQDKQWGGAKHDDRHPASAWASYRGKFENRQQRCSDDPPLQRAQLVKIAALCVAQIESIDRKYRKLAQVNEPDEVIEIVHVEGVPDLKLRTIKGGAK